MFWTDKAKKPEPSKRELAVAQLNEAVGVLMDTDSRGLILLAERLENLAETVRTRWF
jgi:hypothetical protein